MRTATRWRAGAALAAMGLALLAACGGSASNDAGASSSSVALLNYPGWIGKTEIADFEKNNAGLTVKESAIAEGGSAALASQLAQSKGAYDVVLAGNVTAKRLSGGKLLADFDAADVPNIENIPAEYREAYPWGVPTNAGKVGIAYNKDTVKNPPTSWKDLFDRLDEFKGKVVFPDYDRDVVSIAMLALGHDINSTDADELAEAEKLLISAKPDLLALVASGQDKPLLDGSADIAVLYDYTYAGIKGGNVGWVSPSEGTPGYIEGLVPVEGGKNLPGALKFMNNRLAPDVYAKFINATAASFLMPSAEDKIDAAIRENVALAPNADSPFLAEQFLDAKTEKARNSMWERIKAS